MSKYPVALQAISATVPTALFVSWCENLKENEPPKQQKTQPDKYQKVIKIIENWSSGLGAGLGTIVAPRGTPWVSQGRPEPKKLLKVCSFPFPSLFRGHLKMVHFRFGFFGYCVFCGCFPGAFFEGLRAPFREDVGVIFNLFVCVFWKMLRMAPLYKTHRCVLFVTVFREHRPFREKNWNIR